MVKRSYYEEIDEIQGSWDIATASHMDFSDIDRAWLRGNVICIGSGGSYSLAKLWELVHEHYGEGFAKALTPYEFHLSESNPDLVILFSASGKNHDILDVFKSSIKRGIRILIFTATDNSRLVKLAKSNQSMARVIYPSIKIKKDGFLALTSTIVMSCLMAKFQTYIWGIRDSDCFPVELAILDHKEYNESIREIPKRSFYIISSGWSNPAGHDLEARFAESAISPCILTDQRNFGHGRFLWLDRHPKSTHVIFFDSPSTYSLSKRIIKNIPDEVTFYNILSPFDNIFGAIYSIVRSMLLFKEYAMLQECDPGTPDVPEWGRKIHRMKTAPRMVSNQKANIHNNYDINKSIFSAIVLDYDGTIVNTNERYGPINSRIVELFEKLLSDGMSIGIATGRGSSAYYALKAQINKMYHSNIYLGLYNGSLIKKLSDELESEDIKWDLKKFVLDFLLKNYTEETQHISVKQTQISIREITPSQKKQIIFSLFEHLGGLSKYVKFVSSGHSLDIIPNWASKMNLVLSLCETIDTEVLCVGDQGQAGGNDEELLARRPAVCVGSKQPVYNDCFWIGKNIECRETSGTILLLENIVKDSGGFRINTANILS